MEKISVKFSFNIELNYTNYKKYKYENIKKR